MATSTSAKIKVVATRGNELLQQVTSVNPRVAEGLKRAGGPTTAPSAQELEQLMEEEKRRAITDLYQCFLYDVRAMHKRGNFKGNQGDTILHRIRVIGENDEKTLDLSGFNVRDDFALLMVDFLRSRASRLTALNVAHTQIGIEGATAIAKAVNATLEMLQFSENPLPVEVFRKEAQTTRHVVLSGKAFNHLDAAAIGVLVQRESKKLERCDLSENNLTGQRTNVFHGVVILLNGLKKCPRLRELNLSAVNLRAEGLTALADVVLDLTTLEKLDLSSNQLCCNSFGDRNMTGLEAFCNALWQITRLKHLILARNGLDYIACTAITGMLTVNQHLAKLELSGNPVASAGAEELAIGIKKNANLEDLDLRGCELTCEAIKAIADALRKFNRSLQVLNLLDNRGIRSRGYTDLVQCLSINPTLRSVEVNPPPKYQSFVSRIHDLLTVNTSFLGFRRDFRQFDFDSMSEVLRTNFIEKLQELSEHELVRLCEAHKMEEIEIGSIEGFEAAVSTLRFYSEMQQYGPLKRLLWVLESGSRKEQRDKRPQRKDLKSASKTTKNASKTKKNQPRRRSSTNKDEEEHDEEDDAEDIWDYPIL